jgi:hypothetical protein
MQKDSKPRLARHRYADGVKFSFRGAAVRGIICGVLFAVVMYPINFGLGESVADGVGIAVVATLMIYALGRTRTFLRRFANRIAKPS